MSQKLSSAIAVIGIDIGKNSFHIVGHDQRGAIVLRQKWSRGQVEARLANLPPCLIGMECQSAFDWDPRSASKGDPFDRRVLMVALAASELAGVAETARARVV